MASLVAILLKCCYLKNILKVLMFKIQHLSPILLSSKNFKRSNIPKINKLYSQNYDKVKSTYFCKF